MAHIAKGNGINHVRNSLKWNGPVEKGKWYGEAIEELRTINEL